MTGKYGGTRRTLSTAAIAALLAASATVPQFGAGAAAAAPAPATPAGKTAEQAVDEARRTGKPVEVTSATTSTTTVTADPQGTMTLLQSALPQRVKVDGVWQNLDATLARNADGTFSPRRATEPLTLSGGGSGPMAVLGVDGLTMSLSAPMTLPEPTVSGATATYAEVRPGVDLQVTARATGGFAEVFVVHDAEAAADPALAALDMPLVTTGLRVTADAHGNVAGTDRIGRTLLSAAAPMMWDSTAPAKQVRGADGTALDAASRAPALSTAHGPGTAARRARLGVKLRPGHLDLTPDKSLLTGTATRYPVYIDPNFVWSSQGPRMSGWATVAKQFPDTKYWNSTPDPLGRMQVGAPGQITSRTYINFPIPTAVLSEASIFSATFKIMETRSWSCEARRINLYAPTPTLTAANAYWGAWVNTEHGPVVDYADVAHGYNSNCPAAPIAFDVRSKILADVGSNKKTQTFALMANSESDPVAWKEFLETSPSLEIKYNHRPNIPNGLTTSPKTNCGNGPRTVVGDTSVSLYAPVSDRNGGTLGVRFEVRRGSLTGTIIASSNQEVLLARSGTTSVFQLTAANLRALSQGVVTNYFWKVFVTDGNMQSDWSAPCSFTFDATRPGPPEIAAIDDGVAKIAKPVTTTVTPPSAGTAPASYLYQLNGEPYGSINVAASGPTSITVTPTRFTNTLSVTSVSVGGNMGESRQIVFNADQPDLVADSDFTGDGKADLLTVGGKNSLPPGLWAARSRTTAQIDSIPSNLGAYGNGKNLTGNPADFTGAQVVPGRFAGNGLQDVLAYYPGGSNPGSGVVLRGTGDGSPIRADLGAASYSILSGLFEDTNENNPLQLTNAGSYTDAMIPDLLGIAGNATTGHYLNYYPAGFAPGIFNPAYSLPEVLTPTGGTDWNTWTITSAQTSDGTGLFLWQASTGKLFLWNSVRFVPDEAGSGVDAFSHTQHLLSSSWNTGKTLSLSAADINADGRPDLWTVNPSGVVTAWFTGALTADGGSITGQLPQTMTAPTHHWMLNDNQQNTITTARDNVGGSTLTRTGSSIDTPSWDAGDPFAVSADFDGSAGRLSTIGAAVSTTGDFTVSFWTRPEAYEKVSISQEGTLGNFFKIWPSTDTSWKFAMQRTDSVYSGATWDIASSPPTTVKLGMWYHITASYQASSKRMALYVNGDQRGGALRTGAWTTGGKLTVGAAKTAASTYDFHYKGQIANVQTWNAIVNPVLVANWDTRGGSGATLNDWSGYGYHSALTGGYQWHTNGHADNHLGSISLDGVSGYGTANASLVQPATTSFSASAWVYLSNNSQNRTVLSQVSTRSPFYLMYDASCNCWNFALNSANSADATWYMTRDPQPAAINKWVHLAATYNAVDRTSRLYVNGELRATAAGISTWTSTGPTLVGRGVLPWYWQGRLESVRVYQGLLSDDDVITVMNW